MVLRAGSGTIDANTANTVASQIKALLVSLSATEAQTNAGSVTLLDARLKVRPHGQQFSHTTLYNEVVRYKTCRGHAKSCCATNVHTSTIFFINLERLQRKK